MQWAFGLPVKKLKLADSLFAEFVDYMVDMISERQEERAASIERDDLFSALVRASEMEEDSAALSQTELLSNMHIFFFAGLSFCHQSSLSCCSPHASFQATAGSFAPFGIPQMLTLTAETSANTLSAAFMLLALYPEHQTAIYEEAKDVFGQETSPSYSDFSRLVRSSLVLLIQADLIRSVSPLRPSTRRCDSSPPS